MLAKRGRLIAIEGIDGAGKSTLVEQITTYLHQRSCAVTYINRYMLPELTRLWYRLVEQDIADQEIGATLAVADYFTGLERFIRPALSKGDIVLADRYIYSHLVFFGARGVDIRRFQKMFAEALLPDIVFYLSISVEEALNRLRPIMKPNFWEAGLDYSLDMSIGQAYTFYQQLPPNRQRLLIEQHFPDHHRRSLELYPQILPEPQTRLLDGHRPTAELIQRSIQELECILSTDDNALLEGG